MNAIENLHSLFVRYDETDKASKVLESFTKGDLKLLLKCDRVNVTLVDEKLMEVIRSENIVSTICISINHIPMEVINEKSTTEIRKFSKERVYDPCFSTVEDAIKGIRKEGKMCQCVINPHCKKDKIRL